MDCEATNTDTERIACYAAHRAAAAERDRKAREREARERAHREAASPAEAVQLAARMLNSAIASDWDTMDGVTLHSLSTAAAYLAVAARKLAA